METASSDTTLTDRSGCRDLTLVATSCTQIESEMRCAILIRTVANSITPDVGPLSRSPPLDLSHCLRTPAKETGSAPSSTVTTSKMPMSSSSERCASCAAATSSFAMPNETLKARSEPREPSAPAVVIADYLVNTGDVKVACSDCATVDSVLASQQIPTLILRRLFISSSDRATGAGKAHRTSGGGRTHRHAGCVVGCLLGPVVAFGRSEGARMSETLECMRACLGPAGKDLASCEGADAAALQLGFASHRVLRSQSAHLPELRSNHVNTRYGRSSAVLGAGAAIHFCLCSLASRGDDCRGLLLVCESWIRDCMQKLRAWRPRAANGLAIRSLVAETRCLERGLKGVQRAIREFEAQGIPDSCNRVRFVLACMRKAMWPSGKCLSVESQPDLLRWIDSSAFVQEPCVRLEPRHRTACTVNVPLSAVPLLSGGGADSDASSAWDSSSSAASSFGSSGTQGDDTPNCESMATLSNLLESAV